MISIVSPALCFIHYLLSWLIGYLILILFIDKEKKEDWLWVFLATGVGFGVTSGILFFQILIVGHFQRETALLIHVLILVVLLFLARRPPSDAPLHARFPDKKWFGFLMALVLILVLVRLLKSPHGTGIDAWAIWKLKARFLFETEHWRDIFSKNLNFSHPDYPLLYPLMIVWGWAGEGARGFLSPIVVNCLTSMCFVGVMACSFRPFNNISSLWLALWLLSMPIFTGMAGSQYADTALSYYNFCAIVLFDRALHRSDKRLAWTAGLFAGLSTFVKNEGLLFVLSIFLALLVRWYFTRRDKKNEKPEYAHAAFGAALFIGVTLFFKTIANYPSHMLSWDAVKQHALSSEMPIRLLTIGRHFADQVFKENTWVYAWFLVTGLIFFYPKRLADKRSNWILLTGMIMILGYGALYLITPIPLGEHLTHSIDRVLFHVFPVLMYFIFLGEPFQKDKSPEGA